MKPIVEDPVFGEIQRMMATLSERLRPCVIFGCLGITAFAIAMVPTIISFVIGRGGKTGRKVAYVRILCTPTPLNEQFSLTEVRYICFFWPRLNNTWV